MWKNKKEFCMALRTVSMFSAFVLLRYLYEVRFAGYVIVSAVGILWAISSDIENEL